MGAEFISTMMALRVFQGEILAIPLGLLAAEVVHGLGQRLEEARRLGSYELVERLGAGGMGEVWRARHSTLARPAAVKLVRPDALQISNPDRREALLARFEREALATASLTSPHTVEVYDFGVEEDGTFFYVMELLDGIDLHEMVARFGTLPPERAVWFLRQACRSLAEAHDRGLVHRDIKPSNLIACRRGDDVDFLKVVDFGLVTPIDPQTLDDRFTRMGQAPGTPAYMAPEQAKNPLDVDGRADIYSLGCVAFWMLTRSHVFDGPSAFEIGRKHAEEPAPPPSSRALYPIPPQLDSVILECLAKEPERRPRNARVLLGKLAAVPLAEPWTDERAREWWAENRPPRAPTQPDSTPVAGQGTTAA
jgi:serine/threonine-protein kinase